MCEVSYITKIHENIYGIILINNKFLYFHTCNMKKDENTICSKDNVFLNVIKQKTVHTWWYWWARVRLWKWFSVSSWKIAWDSIKEKYVDQIWPWTLMFTNQRMVFLSMEKNVSIKASDIIKAETYYDGITIADDKWTYHFTFADDGWEFCNKFIKYVNPDSPWLPPREPKKASINIFKEYREFDKQYKHRITMWIIFFLCLCYIKSL